MGIVSTHTPPMVVSDLPLSTSLSSDPLRLASSKPRTLADSFGSPPAAPVFWKLQRLRLASRVFG